MRLYPSLYITIEDTIDYIDTLLKYMKWTYEIGHLTYNINQINAVLYR
jgi:hypothetical protein